MTSTRQLVCSAMRWPGFAGSVTVDWSATVSWPWPPLRRRWHQPARAARLYGAADALHESIGETLSPHDASFHAIGRARARTALGEPQFAALMAEGRAWSVEQATTEGLQALVDFAAAARHEASTSEAR